MQSLNLLKTLRVDRYKYSKAMLHLISSGHINPSSSSSSSSLLHVPPVTTTHQHSQWLPSI